MDEVLESIPASTWVAGPLPGHAIDKAVQLHNQRIAAVIQPLEADVRSYMTLLAKINGKRFSVVVNPSHLGLEKGIIEYKNRLEYVLTRADNHAIRVWIDTAAKKVDTVIETYMALAAHYASPGIMLHSNRQRTKADLQRMLHIVPHAHVAIVHDSDHGDFKSQQAVAQNFTKLAQYLVAKKIPLTIACKDGKLVHSVMKQAHKRAISICVQQPMGQAGSTEGVALEQYVPYGAAWKNIYFTKLRQLYRG